MMRVVLVHILIQLVNVKNVMPFTPFTHSHNLAATNRQSSSLSMVFQPFTRIEQDFKALTQRVTAYHILLPKSTEAALSLKQKIRNRVNPPKSSDVPPMYIIDAFTRAAERYSLDTETKHNGGLLGEMLPQGACRRVPELDKACFEAPIGHVAGPIETDYGYHLLLVEERINCENDGAHSKIVRGGTNGPRTLYIGPSAKEGGSDLVRLVAENLSLWLMIFFCGVVGAELAAKAAVA